MDISEWLIHFVHDRNPATDPEQWLDRVPAGVTDGGDILYFDDMVDEWHIEGDASAYSVIARTLHDGFIRASWVIRNGRPTIYGCRPCVCMTEMPLYALVQYTGAR